MKTDELIDRLGREVTVARPLRASGIRTAMWTAWAAGVLAVGAVMMFAVTSSAAVTPTPLFLVQQGAAVVVGITAARAALASVIPGATNRVWAAPAVAAGFWALSLLWAGARDLHASGTLGVTSQSDWPCVASMAVGGLVVGAPLAWMLRRGAPLTPGRTALLAALAALSFANIEACLTRPHAFAMTVLLWHGGTVAAAAALFALTGHRWLRWPAVALTFVCALSVSITPATAQRLAAQPALPDVQTLGPRVGSRVPDFTLLDQKGQSRTLASLMGPKGLMLVFYRSADWCPYCKTQLAELQTRMADLARNGIGLAAISYDAVPVLADFSRRRGITFPLLSDPGSATIRRYGILNTTVPDTNQQSYGIPFPGTFMVNTRGVVTSRFFEPAYQERSTVGSIMARLGNNVDVKATTVSSPQLALTSYATDSTVAPGTQFSLVLDVRPARGVHVYAPGVTGYKPITLSLQSQPGLLTRGAHFPPSEVYHFKPLNERVQVYQRPFRIVQDVLIDASPQAQAALKDLTAMTITGVLNYQACDDKVCFTPQTVPLTWTVSLRQLDRERARP